MATSKKTAAKKTAKTARKSAGNGRRKPKAEAAAVASTEGTTRRKKATKPGAVYGYIIQTEVPVEGVDDQTETKYSEFAGPFASATDAMEDAAMLAGEDAVVVLLKGVKRGRVQKTTKIVAIR